MFSIEETEDARRVKFVQMEDAVRFAVEYQLGALNALSRALKKKFPADVINGTKFTIRPTGDGTVALTLKLKDGILGMEVEYDDLRDTVHNFLKGKANGKEEACSEDAQG